MDHFDGRIHDISSATVALIVRGVIDLNSSGRDDGVGDFAQVRGTFPSRLIRSQSLLPAHIAHHFATFHLFLVALIHKRLIV